MSNLDGAAEIFEQRSLRGNEYGRRGKFGWNVSPSVERASASREKIFAAKESPKPEIPAPAIHIFTGADVTSYNEALPHIRDRVGAVLKIRYEDFDSLCGFASGLSGKVFGASQIKRLGIEKFFDALRGAGLRIRLEEDPEQTAKMLARIAENYNPRQANQARMNNHSHLSEKTIDQVLNYLAGRNGGLRRLKRALKETRSAIGRRAHAARRPSASPACWCATPCRRSSAVNRNSAPA
jgi:hypothetical protein